jgi:hypothetical protein
MVQPTQAAHSDYSDAVRETLHTELYRLQAYLLALDDGLEASMHPSEQRLLSNVSGATQVWGHSEQ